MDNCRQSMTHAAAACVWQGRLWGGDSFDTQRNRHKKPLKPNIGAGCSGFIA
ncbi:hypothetical protein LHGZ1_3416 [Laribacter hongkongensis]|uniref:Uncharacterized protein n=1 Tax=Laribacter hongkongensis TaxID=168471 RepID=A0A248LNA4_9NEIS|nr:hypothetical protein LHGZ1_3416 [Laribacter hongkongensis]